jgi:hypothetical protein
MTSLANIGVVFHWDNWGLVSRTIRCFMPDLTESGHNFLEGTEELGVQVFDE